MKRKIMFGLGALAATAAPIIAVVSCGCTAKKTTETTVAPVDPEGTIVTPDGTTENQGGTTVNPVDPVVNTRVAAKTTDVISWLKNQDLNTQSFGDEKVDFSILNRILYTTDEVNEVDIVAVKLDANRPFQTLNNIDRCINFIKGHDQRKAIIYVRGADDAPEPEIIKFKGTVVGEAASHIVEKLRELKRALSIRKGFYQDGRSMPYEKEILKETTMILGNKLVFDQSKDPNYLANTARSWDRDAGSGGYLNNKFDNQFALIRKFFADNADRNVHVAMVYLVQGNFKVAMLENLAPLQRRPYNFQEFLNVLRDKSNPNFRTFNFASEMYEHLDTL